MVMNYVAQPSVANVVQVTGVPKLWSTVISAAEAVASVELDTLLQSYLIQQADKQWGIFDSKNTAVITSGRVRSMDIEAQYSISDAPLENGGFLSYNKVKHPGRVMIEMICDGTTMSYGNYGSIASLLSSVGITSGGTKDLKVRAEFLATLDSLVADLNVYNVTTPEGSYHNMNVVAYRMRRGVEGGITMLRVQILMDEVRLEAMSSTSGTPSTAAGATSQNGGNVQSTSSLPEVKLTGATPYQPVNVTNGFTLVS